MNKLSAPTQPSQLAKCFLVYVLQGQNGGYYIGCTSNLPARLQRHRAGEVKGSAKLGAPSSLVYLHAWRVPDAFSGDLLETFAWRFHRAFGIKHLIELAPHWSSELRFAASQITPNAYEIRHKYSKRPSARTATC